MLQAISEMRFRRVEPKSQRLSKTLFLDVYLEYPRHSIGTPYVNEIQAAHPTAVPSPQMAWPRQMSLEFGMPRATGYLEDGFGES